MRSRFRQFRGGAAALAVILGAAIGVPIIATHQTPTSPASVFVAQVQAGSGNGSSCANAEPLSFFNSAANWGAGKAIAPGTTVGLCGTVTASVDFQASGTSGNPITLRLEPGARISVPTCGCIDASANRSWITVDGGTNGIVEGTDNGVGLGHQTADRAIDMQTCSHCTVTNLTIRNIFVMPSGGTASDPIDHTLSRAVSVDGTDFTFTNNVVHDVGWAIYDNAPTNVRIEGNEFYNFDHAIVTSGGGTGPVVIDRNHFHDMGNWDCGGGCHHDGYHCFTVNGGTANHYTNGIYIYDNRFDGTVGSDNTSWIFLESNTGAGATPCADATSPVYVFNNYLTETDHAMNNGIMTPASGQLFAYNNTVVGIRSTNTGGYAFDCCAGNNGQGAYENNVLSTVNNFGGWLTADFSVIDHDVYADAGGAASLRWTCNGSATNTFATFQSGCGEAHGTFTSGSASLSGGVPQAGSPALNAAANLTGLCTGNVAPLCSDINGHARPAAGAWDAGAFEVSG